MSIIKDKDVFARYFAITIFFAVFTYLFINKEKQDRRLQMLENQISVLTETLKNSNLVNESTKKELQEISNRNTLVAKSQDDLLTSAVAKATPAVVSIVVSQDVPLLEVIYQNPFGNDPYFRGFDIRVPTYRQIGTEKRQVGAGTGFLFRTDGYIITNRHVVDNIDAEYTALLSTGEQKSARVVYRDETYDIAVLKIDGGVFPTISFGDSKVLKLGQTVAAIGNALGEYNNSVSVGIISGLDRMIEAQDDRGRLEKLTGVIQTDAAINQGNSGGPLLNLKGEAIGINVATRLGASNISFAIPSNDIETVIRRALP